jgi:hypothetical protein
MGNYDCLEGRDIYFVDQLIAEATANMTVILGGIFSPYALLWIKLEHACNILRSKLQLCIEDAFAGTWLLFATVVVLIVTSETYLALMTTRTWDNHRGACRFSPYAWSSVSSIRVIYTPKKTSIIMHRGRGCCLLL